MKWIFIVFICLCIAEPASAQDSLATFQQKEIQYDSDSQRIPVSLNPEKIETYKNDDAFHYVDPAEEANWQTLFKQWLSNIWNSFWHWLLGDSQGSGFWSFVIHILPYLILAGLIGFIIWLFFKLNPGARLLQTKEEPAIFFTEEEEIIKTKDIQKLIDKALKNNNYRLAVRFYYLLILKRLTEAELIEYEFDKTNSDYFSEITSETINTGFRKATNLYDYIWYGNFTVTEADFKKAQVTFNQLNTTIPKGR